MVNRIPPSLKWLIDKRGQIAGELEGHLETLMCSAFPVIKSLKTIETCHVLDFLWHCNSNEKEFFMLTLSKSQLLVAITIKEVELPNAINGI